MEFQSHGLRVRGQKWLHHMAHSRHLLSTSKIQYHASSTYFINDESDLYILKLLDPAYLKAYESDNHIKWTPFQPEKRKYMGIFKQIHEIEK